MWPISLPPVSVGNNASLFLTAFANHRQPSASTVTQDRERFLDRATCPHHIHVVLHCCSTCMYCNYILYTIHTTCVLLFVATSPWMHPNFPTSIHPNDRPIGQTITEPTCLGITYPLSCEAFTMKGGLFGEDLPWREGRQAFRAFVAQAPHAISFEQQERSWCLGKVVWSQEKGIERKDLVVS